MAKSFNISAIFTAVNKLTAPVKQMTQQISQFAQVTRNASSSANAAFHSTGTAAQSAASKIRSSFNNINFNRLKFQIKNLQGHIKDIGQSATTMGAVGIGAGAAVYKGLDPLREKQSVVTRFGTLYGQGKTPEERKKLGEAEFAKTQDMATRLPGAVQDFAEARAMTKNFGLEGSFDLLKGFTNISSAIGEKFDGEFIRALQAGAGGNDVDLFKKFGLKAGSDKGKTKLTDVATGKETVFKNPADVLKFISQLGNKKYAGSTEEYMKTITGKESNVGDALSGSSINFAEQSGLAQLYTEKLDLLTEVIPKVGQKLTELLGPIMKMGIEYPKVTNGVLVGIPALLALGVGAQVLSFAIGGLIPIFTGLSAAVAFLISPIGLTIAAVAALAGSVYLIYNNWDGIKTYFNNLWGDIKSGVSMLGEWLTNYFTNLWGDIKAGTSMLYDAGVQLVTNIWNGVTSKWSEFKSWLLSQFSDLLSNVPIIGASLSASIAGSGMPESGNLAQPSKLSQPDVISSANTTPPVNVNINQTHNVAPNGQVNSVSQVTSSGGKVNVKNDTGESRRTSK